MPVVANLDGRSIMPRLRGLRITFVVELLHNEAISWYIRAGFQCMRVVAGNAGIFPEHELASFNNIVCGTHKGMYRGICCSCPVSVVAHSLDANT